ncbi:hypothetical protein HDN1F_03160 [gamma proteobacterium HdN1]|nr:hypothetical protein HDN1F_03160 [gamma proteobacterium HdN1]
MLQELKPEINFCSCGCEARLVKENTSSGKRRKPKYFVACLDEVCGKRGKVSSFPWQAILEWNAGEESEFPDDFPVPFVNAFGLTNDETRQLLARKRNHCEEQIQKLKGANNNGASAQEKLKSLHLQLDWLRYGQTWLDCRTARL